MNQNPLVAKAIEICGSQSALARKCGGKVKQQNVRQWLYMKRVPAERAVEIEKATDGKVTRAELRPDLFLCECKSTADHRAEYDKTTPQETPHAQTEAA